MKKLLFCLLLFSACVLHAQEAYWTNYQIVVPPDEVETVYNLMNDYFSANTPQGVTVSLWENHFNDHGNNFTHSVGFSGSLEDMGNFYTADGGAAWKLFLVQLNQHIAKGYSARMGTIAMVHGDTSLDYPVQKYFIVHADDGAVWDKAYAKYSKENLPAGTMNSMGDFTSGVSADRENRWVINGFKDFKAAIGGANAMRSDAEKSANEKAWKTFLDTNGESHLVRSGTRVRVGQWK
ncbi:MAG TPA: hypothetical protein VKN36_13750 [Eudoraea sp.]|nr:hypothetical protein [Eudoraea sp.]